MRPWLASGALVAALCCGFVGDIGTNPNRLTFWYYAADPTVVQPALECALKRVRAATCLPVDISYDAHVWVRQRANDDPVTCGGISNWFGCTSQGYSRIWLRETLINPCNTLVHEIGQHVLRRSYSHAGSSAGYLHEAVLQEICAEQPCVCFHPEALP